MDEKQRCQSCGMPLGEFKDKDGKLVTNFGTERNGLQSQEYCMFCYQKGKFTSPNLTVEKMVQLSVDFMTTEFKMPELKARTMSEQIIPHLKRWKKNL